MRSQNRYCCRCHQTTQFAVADSSLTCTRCGVIAEVPKESPAESRQKRSLIGDPMRSFKTSFAA